MQPIRLSFLLFASLLSFPVFSLADGVDSKGSWYVTGIVGDQFSQPQASMSVPNGSGFPSPFNLDTYTTQTTSSWFGGIGAGYQFKETIIQAASLGIEYLHLFDSEIGNQIIQYSLPQFTNYNYSWKLESDVFLMTTKLNGFHWKNFMPYLKAGLGLGINRAHHYNEQALAGITPRISPDFGSKSRTSFVYRLGIGVDWFMAPQWVFSLGYAYADLGDFSSDRGTNTWSGGSLSSSRLRTNAVELGLTYML